MCADCQPRRATRYNGPSTQKGTHGLPDTVVARATASGVLTALATSLEAVLLQLLEPPLHQARSCPRLPCPPSTPAYRGLTAVVVPTLESSAVEEKL